MAVLYITEFTNEGKDQRGDLVQEALLIPPVAEQTVAIGASSVASAAFNSGTALVRITADAICSIAFGEAPVATAANLRLAANTFDVFAVPPGLAYKVAVITNV